MSANAAANVLDGRYEIQRQLGRNAGRQTLLARDLQTQDLVVVKLLAFGNDFRWDDLKLFEREAEILKTLAHPAIPRYLDFFEVDRSDWKGFALVQTHIDASSLQQQLRSGRTFSEAEVQELAKSILEVLIYLHDRQPTIIHRDIKPSNILVTNRSGNSVGQVYLVDFGSVQTAIKEGSTITVVGTYGYMPPEQFGGRSTPASDLYSLGATLIRLVTGKEPADLPQKDLRIQFEPATTNLSPSLIRWLKWLTEPSQDRRPASARVALQALVSPQTSSRSGLVVTGKPYNSRIRLNKKTAFLEILLPQRRFGSQKLQLWMEIILFFVGLALATPTLVIMCVVFILALTYPPGVGVALIILVLSLFLGLPGFLMMLPLIGRWLPRLEHFYLRRSQDGELHYLRGRSLTYLSPGIEQRLDPTLYPFTPQEMDWLAHEISIWLDVPLILRDRP